MEKVIINDDQGRTFEFETFEKLIEYANSCSSMSWLPDGFTWKIIDESEDRISAYKDGLADAILEGHRAEHHENMHFYKLGYDYGITLYSRLQELEAHEQAIIDNQHERR